MDVMDVMDVMIAMGVMGVMDALLPIITTIPMSLSAAGDRMTPVAHINL